MTQLLVDTMLGRLATYLRMCGYDTVYTLDAGIEADDAILARGRERDRTILTRDRELAARSEDSILLESRNIESILAELAEEGLDLGLPEVPRRCSSCNGTLVAVSPEATTPKYAPDSNTEDVWRCRECGQHFWKGSHWDDVAETLEEI
jgi:uncharacterized protein with PIN domain